MPKGKGEDSVRERHKLILDILKNGAMRKSEIKRMLKDAYKIDVSHTTISKDIQKLVKLDRVVTDGKIIRLAGLWGEPYAIRSITNLPQKMALGRFITEKYVDLNRIVVLDTGTTMAAIARCIVRQDKNPLGFETNNLDATLELIKHPKSPTVRVWGGEVIKSIASTFIEEQNIVDLVGKNKVVLVGLGGISQDGDFFVHNYQHVAMKRGLLRSDSEKTIIAVDSSKIGVQGFVQVADLKKTIASYIKKEKRSYIVVTNSKPPKNASPRDKEAFRSTLEKLEEVDGITVECVD